MGHEAVKKIEKMIEETNTLKNSIVEVNNRIFRLESEYLDLTQGHSLFRNLEFYIHTKPEKKKNISDESERTFSREFPR